MISQQISMSCISSSATISGVMSDNGSTQVVIDAAFTDATTDSMLSVSFTTAALRSLVLYSTGDCTIETNSGSAPDQTINLKADKPYLWSHGSGYFANPITHDVTAFYVTAAMACHLQGRILF